MGALGAGWPPSLHLGCVYEIESLKVIARTNRKYVLVLLCIQFPSENCIFSNAYLRIRASYNLHVSIMIYNINEIMQLIIEEQS